MLKITPNVSEFSDIWAKTPNPNHLDCSTKCKKGSYYRIEYSCDIMPSPVQNISEESITLIKSKINDTIENGMSIRQALADYSNSDAYDINWEVQAAVEALQVFGSRWTIEILSTLYIAGPRRFNEMKALLEGISSRTLSDKLTLLASEGLINRTVDEGPPVRVAYALSEHGIACGRLLSPLVAHLKIRSGSVQ